MAEGWIELEWTGCRGQLCLDPAHCSSCAAVKIGTKGLLSRSEWEGMDLNSPVRRTWSEIKLDKDRERRDNGNRHGGVGEKVCECKGCKCGNVSDKASFALWLNEFYPFYIFS